MYQHDSKVNYPAGTCCISFHSSKNKRSLFVLFCLFIAVIGFPLSAQTISMPSALAAPGDTIEIPIKISEEVLEIVGFQMDLTISPSSGAPVMTIADIAKGEAILTTPDIDTNPWTPTSDTPIRIGLPVEIPIPPDPKPSFNGPGVLAWIELNIPSTAIVGDTYSLSLSNIILAGPDSLAIPVAVYDATITIGTITVFPDTMTAPDTLTVAEGMTESLTITITGNNEPIPGIPVHFTIDNPAKASISSDIAVTNTNGEATIVVTGNEDGNTTVHATSSGLPEEIIEITVLGVSPIITSDPLLEIAAGSTYTYDVQAMDPNGDTLLYSLLTSPDLMTIDPDTGLITWTPPAGQPQTGNNVLVEVRDPSGNTDTQSFSIFITVDADSDGYDNRVDCDDFNPLINPGVPEECNGIDDNCNSIIDEGVIFDYYLDADGDGYGNSSIFVTDCSAPAGYVPVGGDCDDTDPDINPGRKEIGDNGIDEDCNPFTPDNWSQSFIAAISDSGIIYYAKSNGNGSFSDYRSLRDIGEYNSRGITINDFNNDGYLDIIAGGGVSSRIDYFLFLNDGTDMFFNQGIVLSEAVSGSYTEDMTSGDFNNDGYNDFIGQADSGQVIIALGNGKGEFTSSIIDLGARSRGLDSADFNNDNILDIIRSRYSDGYGYVALGNGDGTFGDPVYVGDFGDDPYGVAAADFDNDGMVDIIANSGSNGDSYFYKGHGNGTFTQIGYITTLDTNRHGSFDGYDLNNDDNVDIILSNYNGYNLYFYPGNGDGTFGSAVQISTSNTSGYVLAISAPPYRIAQKPLVVIDPPVVIIPPGGSVDFDGSASHTRESGTIVSWEWNFGDGTTGSDAIISHTYGMMETIYTVTLKVTDNNGRTGIGIAKVYVQGDVPSANAGGPYTFGEAFVNNGLYTVTLDGTQSTDDSQIIDYEWNYGDFINDSFTGLIPDTHTWIISPDAAQDESLTITGSGSWGNRYIFSQESFLHEENLTFYLKVVPVNTSGNQYGMFGFKNDNTNYSYNQMPYAIYFNNQGIYIYENGTNRGQVSSYTRGQEYEIKIVLSSTSAAYYMKAADDPYWDLIYISGITTSTPLKTGAVINAGTFSMDDALLNLISHGPNPVRLLTIGTYPVRLIVTDMIGQQDSDDTTIGIIANDAPVADPGGPYTAGEINGIGGEWYISFDGSNSTDDFGILSYEWDFDNTDGLQAESGIITPIHRYTAPGVYTVSLTVTDHAMQTHTATALVTISTAGIPPVANPGGPYVVNEDSAYGGLWTVIMDGSGSFDDLGISRYEWDFGDGTNSTTYYSGENTNAFATGTDLYGYDVADAGLRIIATENNTHVKIIDLETGEVTASTTLNRYSNWWNAAPGDNRYFKVESDNPVLAYESDFGGHTAFAPSLESGPVGRNFTLYYYTSANYYVFAYENTIVTFYNTSGTQVAQSVVNAGSYWNPGVSNNAVYRVYSTGRISMQNEAGNAYTSVPSSNGDNVGTLFYGAVNGSTSGGGFIIFAYEGATISVFDMDTAELLYTQTLNEGESNLTTNVGTRRLRFESTGAIEIWAGDFEGGSSIVDLGDDISVTHGKMGREFYLNSLRDGAVIFAPYDNTQVDINGTITTLDADGFHHIPGNGNSVHVTSSRPIVVQTLGRANTFNDEGTYLGGRSAIRHYYNNSGIYTLALTVVDNAGLSHTAATTVSVEESQPPVADPGGPYVLNESDAFGGVWTVHLDGTNSSDDYCIYRYEWDFDDSNGIQVNSNDPAPITTYNTPGIYTVTLTVYDNALQATQATTTVTVLANSPPIADAGGPYTFGEEAASYGVWTASLDGSLSRDDYHIYNYLWFLDPAHFDFSGTIIDDEAWNYGSSTIQNDGISINGPGSWGSQYIFSKKEFETFAEVTFQGRILPENTSGNQYGMFGLKAPSNEFSYTKMPCAIYFRSGTIYIYENGTSRGVFGNYTRNALYDIRITLKETGAMYYYKAADSDTWSLLYDSSSVLPAYVNIGASINAGTFRILEMSISEGSEGMNPNFKISEPGTYNVTLTVMDNAMQRDTDTTTITISDSNPPIADAGGPYTAEVGSILLCNGSGSMDDVGIETYEWIFGDFSKTPDGLMMTGKGVTPEHIYKEVGTYEITLIVTDNTGKSDTDITTVTVSQGDPPVARPGFSYLGGANGPPVYFDGSSSTDDFGIVEYRWDVDDKVDSDNDGNFTNDIDIVGRNPFYTYAKATGAFLQDGFNGTTIDTASWITSGATQDNQISITGANSWTNRYIFSQENFIRNHSTIFRAQVLPLNETGTQRMMWGAKNTNTNYSYNQMPHAIYLNDGSIYIYENGSNRGVMGTYTNGTLYDLSIELTTTGAIYSIKEAAASAWTVLYESTSTITTSPLKIGATINAGTFLYDDFIVQGPDHYTATLTVEDGAGQLSSATTIVNIAPNLPPNVITVPWVSHDISVPHEAYNGKAVTLKGIVRDADPVTFQWDFGDGTKSDLLNVTNPYDLSVTHMYPEVQPGTPFVATLTVWDSTGESGSDNYNIIVKNKSLSVETNIAIDEGLWYLHRSQTRTTTGIYPSGWWRISSYYSSATAAAIQAFEINSHLEQGNHRENPYVETVDRGLKYLFTKVSSAAIDLQTYGDPDTNGNGIGIQVNESQPIYQGGPVMDAIASSKSMLTRTVTGGANIARRTYLDILTDMADMFAWGQDENANGGGWRYTWNSFPDNSAAQWGAIGLQAAQDIFGIPIPEWVKVRNEIWLNYSYDGTGFGYTSAGNGRATTPSGMVQLAFNGDQTSDGRWRSAENYIADNWSVTNSESVIYQWLSGEYTRDYYAMYAFVKAMRLAQPHPIVTLRSTGLDWYNDPETGMARCVIDDQLEDGRIMGSHRSDNHLRTAWGVIILSQTLFIQPPVANAGQDRVWGVNIPLTFDASASFHLDPFREIVQYEWDFNGDGIYDSVSTSPFAEYTYTDDPSTLPKNYLVSLRVTDNNSPPLTDTDTVVITIAEPPHPPIADAGGPYTGTAGLPVTLDGTGSFEIDPTDIISSYEWELNSVYPYDFDEASGPTPAYIWNTPGTYIIGLRVLDNGVMNDLNNDGIVDENERLSDQDFTTITIVTNEPPVADAGGPYVINEGTTVTLDGSGSMDPNGDPIYYAWDLDGDGNYDDGDTSILTSLFMDNGSYTIGLEVTDTLLTAVDTTIVTVNDLAPHAAFTWSPVQQEEGLQMQFVDQSTSYPDTIISWAWDFAGLGTSTDQNPLFTFNDNGTYPVTLTVTDEDGSTDTITHNVTIINVSPVVDAGADQSVFTDQVITFAGTFTDQGIDDTHTIIWDFADGTTVAGTLNPTHVYTEPGIYIVLLSVTDDDGATGTDTVTITVEKENNEPIADAGDDRTVESINGESVLVTLDGSESSDPDGDDLTYRWTGPFGTADGVNPQVLLPVGIHTITLTVSDGELTDTDDVEITVIRTGDLVHVIIKLIDSNGNGIPGGIAHYLTDTWQEAGATDENGEIHIDMYPDEYKFSMNYLNVINHKVQNVALDNIVIFTTKNVEVKLIDSTGNGIPGGIAEILSKIWIPIGVTDSNGSIFVELLPYKYKFSMTYLGTTLFKEQDITEDPIVIFTTTKVEVKLVDSAGNGIEGGIAQVLSKTWIPIGTTNAQGSVFIELLPYKYKFSMTYLDISNFIEQDVAQDPTVVFSTTKVEVKLLDSTGIGIEGGIAQVLTKTWHPIGITNAQGSTYIELLPYKYKFSMTYLDITHFIEEDIAVNPVIVFSTTKAEVKLVDSTGNGIAGGIAQVLTKTWIPIGTTDTTGSVSIELLSYEYKFSMTYLDTSNFIIQDIADNPVIIFSTTRVEVKLVDSMGNGIAGGIAKVLTKTWEPIGTTDTNGSTYIELLDYTYKFTMDYLGGSIKIIRDIEVDPVVIFATVNAEVKLLDTNGDSIIDYSVSFQDNDTWHIIETSDTTGSGFVELLPCNYYFKFRYDNKIFNMYQDLSVNQIVIFQL